MSRIRLLPLLLLCLVVAAGCPQGSVKGPISTPGADQTVPAEELKIQLESFAETGEMFPGYETMSDNIATIKGADADKGAALEKAFTELEAAFGEPDDVKAKAKEMLEML